MEVEVGLDAEREGAKAGGGKDWFREGWIGREASAAMG
jgi:hypothetical protein